MKYDTLRFVRTLIGWAAVLMLLACPALIVFAFTGNNPLAPVLVGVGVAAGIVGLSMQAGAEALDVIIGMADNVSYMAARIDTAVRALERTAAATEKLAATIPTPKH